MKVSCPESGTSAEVILRSRVTTGGRELVTFVIEYPHFILPQFLTHRDFSRNTESSRAVPWVKNKQHLNAKPVRFGKHKAGMQDDGAYTQHFRWADIHGNAHEGPPEGVWEAAKEAATYYAEVFANAGVAKQVYNRLVEPYKMIKMVVSATEWANFYKLRVHASAADPTIYRLAALMYKAHKEAPINWLKPGDWHLPFVTEEDKQITTSLYDLIKISVARSAAISYRNEQYQLEKCLELYTRLIESDPMHASAAEHQAQALDIMSGLHPGLDLLWKDGMVEWRSGNFGPGWIQYRQTLPNNSAKQKNWNEEEDTDGV